MKQLADFIRSQVQMDGDVLKTVLAHFQERVVAKEKFVLKKGHIATDYFFIQSGGLRVFMDEHEKQVTGWIALENEFFTELSSFKNQTPSQFYIQAIEDSVLWTIKLEAMERLYRQFPQWQEFGRLVWESAFLKVTGAIISYQTMTAEERYLLAMEQSELLQRVSLKDLSSFLGITPNSLSRIRKNIK